MNMVRSRQGDWLSGVSAKNREQTANDRYLPYQNHYLLACVDDQRFRLRE